MNKRQKIVVLAGFDESLLNFRGELLRSMVRHGHEVLAAAPMQTPGVPEQLAALGVRFVAVDLERASLNPISDWKTRRALARMFAREKPDVVLAYTIKPVAYGIPAAHGVGVPRCFALITGLGAAFHSPGLKGWILEQVASALYRRAFKRCGKVLVQNQDIAELFTRKKIVEAGKVTVVPGSGVDTKRFAATPVPVTAPVFLLLARMLRDKGVEEYVAAARIVKTSYPAARFLLVGNTDPNPAAISQSQLDAWNQAGIVEYFPAVLDVRPLLATCTAYVLPSYHEGMPRSVLEAMATGRPVVTTDTIGCRETIYGVGSSDAERVREGENGFLVPVRDAEALARAMSRLAANPALGAVMGRRGREIAERQFDVRRINDVMLRLMELSPAVETQPPVA